MDDIVISEKKLEDYLCGFLSGELESDSLREHLASNPDVVERQFSLGNYGVPDIVTFHIDPSDHWAFDTYLGITIYELKKGKINYEALDQIVKYKKGMMEYLDNFTDLGYHIECVLIGNGLDISGGFLYIPDCFNDISFYTYDLDINGGLKIESNSWHLTDAEMPHKLREILTCFDYVNHDFRCDKICGGVNSNQVV